MFPERAPCGHVGERVIGAYVRCTEGCEGARKQALRGDDGHVEGCACARCQIKRKAVSIELVGSKGELLAKADWNGRDDIIRVVICAAGWCTSMRLVDAEGKAIRRCVPSNRGKPEMTLVAPGNEVRINLNLGLLPSP